MNSMVMSAAVPDTNGGVVTTLDCPLEPPPHAMNMIGMTDAMMTRSFINSCSRVA
jgi:hypothetical protein